MNLKKELEYAKKFAEIGIDQDSKEYIGIDGLPGKIAIVPSLFYLKTIYNSELAEFYYPYYNSDELDKIYRKEQIDYSILKKTYTIRETKEKETSYTITLFKSGYVMFLEDTPINYKSIKECLQSGLIKIKTRNQTKGNNKTV